MKTVAAHPNLVVVDHPLVQHKMALLRDVETWDQTPDPGVLTLWRPQ